MTTLTSIKTASFLGLGLGFPFEVSTKKGGISTQVGLTLQEAIDKVRSSVLQILYTALGERFFNRSFGCKARQLLFQPADFFFLQELLTNITEALNKWEKRITVRKLDVSKISPKNALVTIDVEIVINETMQQGTTTIPYYFADASMSTVGGPVTANI
mgnify:CR=1 FL=1